MASVPARRESPFFTTALALLLLFAVVHTLWATSLDGFTLDEPYHVAAGASYLRWGDFRVNPEHPPLVKLIAGLSAPPSILHLTPPAIVTDKWQERIYTQTAVFIDSDGPRIHRRARIALTAFNTLLLAVLTLLLRRIFDTSIALATLLLLALDPTVSAHMPVVMTDLPMALLGTICCCLTVLALRDGLTRDWLFFGLAAGLLLATKHSAPLIVLPLAAICLAVLLWRTIRRQPSGLLTRQFAGFVIAAAISLTVLWSTYGFRYHESRLHNAGGQFVDTFNRPLEAKITDLRSPGLRYVLTTAQRIHFVPRAYLWGLADTLRAGVEGRPIWIAAFGHSYQGKAPAWVPFADLLVKLPIGFTLLALAGVALLLLRKLPAETTLPLILFAAIFVLFMGFIAKNGIFYAGLRHWLFAVPLLAIFAAVCIHVVSQNPRLWVRVLPSIAILWIAVTVLPQRRIWEYHNAIGGGTDGAWRLFDNESVDLAQRSDELIPYIKSNISPTEPIINYWLFEEQLKSVHLKDWDPTPEQVGDGHITGWMIVRACSLPVNDWNMLPTLRDTPPTTRLGNVFIYHGTFFLPRVAAGVLSFRAFRLLDEATGDHKLAEQYFKRAVQLNPESVPAFIELGNFALGRHDKPEAIRLYQLALTNEKHDPTVRTDIAHQIDLVRTSPMADVPPMRNPNKE